MKVGVKILPRNEILDTQGRTIQKSLEQNGQTLAGCRMGKYIELNIETCEPQEALQKARKVTESTLYNPLIESYELELLHESNEPC